MCNYSARHLQNVRQVIKRTPIPRAPDGSRIPSLPRFFSVLVHGGDWSDEEVTARQADPVWFAKNVIRTAALLLTCDPPYTGFDRAKCLHHLAESWQQFPPGQERQEFLDELFAKYSHSQQVLLSKIIAQIIEKTR